MMNKLYKVSEVAEILRVNRNCVYMLIRNNELRAFDINGLKIAEDDLKAFISSRNAKFETLGKEKE